MTRGQAASPQLKRAAIYCRISQDREGRELGVQRQDDDCRALAERMGYTVVGIYADNDISASTRTKKKRPEYAQMLTDARTGQFELIVAYTSGRLTRRPREHEDLIELAEGHGIQFEYVSSPSFDLNTSAGRRIARILAANDAGEAEDIQERVSRQRQQAASLGEWSGGRRPYGYEADGTTVLPSEAVEVLRASEAILAGASINGLVKDWNARGLTTTAGGSWTGRSLSRMLRRPRNAGLMEHQGEVVGQARWAPIVPEHTWRGVVAVLSDPARRTTPGPVRRWLGSGLYLCHCGAHVYMHVSGGTNRMTHQAYTCSARKHLTRIAGPLDQYVGMVVVERLSKPDAAGLLARPGGEDTASLALEAAALRAQMDELATMYARRVLSATQLERGTSELRGQLAVIEGRMAEASRGSVFAGVVDAADVGAAWESLALDRKRAMIKELMTVRILPSRRGRPPGWKSGESYFDPETVEITWRGQQVP